MAKSKKTVLFQSPYKNKETFKGAAADIFFERDNVKKFAPLHQLISEKYIEWLLPYKKNISTILEIGCGTGHRLNSLCSQLEAKGIGIEPGKKADLLVVDGNPDSNISDLRNIVDVFQEGRVVDRSDKI